MSDRQTVLDYAFNDWKRMVEEGLSPSEARERVFADYELLEREKEGLIVRMHPVVEKNGIRGDANG
jgi:hypothetical protein